MIRRATPFFSILLAASVQTPVAAAVPVGYIEERLPNGLLVSIVADPSHPVVATQLWVHTGSSQEDETTRGLAHLFEHLMFGGTEANPRGAYERLVHNEGGYDNAYTSPDETVYVSEIPPAKYLELLAVEADRMRNLVVTDENLGNEKRIVLEELRLRTENDPISRALVAAQKQLLGSHPYAWDASGEKGDIERATVETARGFHAAHYRPEHAHLVIVGPVQTGEVLAVVRERFGSWQQGAAAQPEVPALTTWTFPDEIDLAEDIPPAEIAVIGAPLPPADAPDAHAVDVLIELLSGGTFDRFREEIVIRRGRAVEAGTEVLRLRRGGAIIFWAASLPYRRRVTAFRDADAAVTEMAGLGWLTDDSLAAAKRSLRRKILDGRWYAAQRASAIGTAGWWEGDPRLAFDEDLRIAAVTREEVEAAFQRYVVKRPPVRLYLRPEHVPWYVRMFGWIYPLVDGR